MVDCWTLDAIFAEGISKHQEKGFDVVSINGTEGTQSESVRGGYLSGIDGESMLVAIVVYPLEIPVGVVGIEHAGYQA